MLTSVQAKNFADVSSDLLLVDLLSAIDTFDTILPELGRYVPLH